MRGKSRITLLMTALTLTSAAVSADEKVWTFDDCVEWATTNNTAIRRTMLNIQTARQESARILERQQHLSGDDVVRTLKLGILEAYLNIM